MEVGSGEDIDEAEFEASRHVHDDTEIREGEEY